MAPDGGLTLYGGSQRRDETRGSPFGVTPDHGITGSLDRWHTIVRDQQNQYQWFAAGGRAWVTWGVEALVDAARWDCWRSPDAVEGRVSSAEAPLPGSTHLSSPASSRPRCKRMGAETRRVV